MKLLLADDHALFQEGFSMIIKSKIIESKVITASNWREAFLQVEAQDIDVALLDLFMPGTKPWQEELSAFLSFAPDVPVCIVSSSNNQSHIKQAFKLGVKGYIRKTSGAAEVKNALYKVLNGGIHMPSSDWQNFHPSIDTASLKLTRRQTEILILITEGNSNKQIGLLLDIAEGTVKRHVYNLFQALGAKSRIDAIQIAKSHGLVLNQ